MKTILISILTVSFTSCMHLAMMGGHSGNGSTHESQPAPVLEKEITAGNVKATATFPPLQVGRETMFTVKLEDKANGKPISNARLSFHVQYLHTGEQHQMSGMNDMNAEMDTSQAHTTGSLDSDQEVSETSTAGTYSTGFTPFQAGVHKIMFHVRSIDGKQLPEEIIVEAERNAFSSGDGHGGGMMGGMGGTSDYFILGAIVMGLMMIGAWVVRGSVF